MNGLASMSSNGIKMPHDAPPVNKVFCYQFKMEKVKEDNLYSIIAVVLSLMPSAGGKKNGHSSTLAWKETRRVRNIEIEYVQGNRTCLASDNYENTLNKLQCIETAKCLDFVDRLVLQMWTT